ncbi:hypothetical protein ACJIZ3_003171 [Penstemon smallii]|uniref:AT-hook motif nuclear-localized protein n=1 Tax=Penstemon smallii TaxID=265156 RepID=A0ABD3UB35_9LAMI
MKREYAEEKQAAHHSDTNTIFSHHQNDDGDPLPLLLPPPPSSHDGATIEVSRRPRGRPPGSKNKPKPPTVITTTSSNEPPMSPYVLELPPGVDIIESTTRFSRKRGIGLCILNGNGVVSNVTLKQPSTTTPASTVTFHGRFDVLTISATILSGSGGNGSGNFSISLAGPQGQVVGGLVVGPLVAAGTVYLIASSFNNPSFHVLRNNDDLDRGGVGLRDETSQPVSVGGDVSNYSYPPPPPPSDVIWAPTARPPLPPY